MDTYIEQYTPCRLHELFLDSGDQIEIAKGEGVFRLRGMGRKIWLLLDGKHTIGMIVDFLFETFNTDNRDTMKQELIAVLTVLQKKNAIVMNWHPLYKLSLCQTLV